MTPDEFRAAFDVFVTDGETACFEFVTDEQGFTKGFASRVAEFFQKTVGTRCFD